MRPGVASINLYRPGKHLTRLLQRLAPHLVERLATLEVVVVRSNVGGLRLLDRLFLSIAQRYLQRMSNALGDLILDGKHILHLAIVTFRPHRMSSAGLH